MEKVAVVGVGTMGWGIAQVFAEAGYDVVLCGRNIERGKDGKASMEKVLRKLVEKGKVEAARADEILSHVIPGTTDDTADCILAVEAISEDMAVKKETLLKLEQLMKPDTILATNTSSLSITELSTCLKDPSRLIGMHFFNPATLMKLVEVIGGTHTSAKVMETILGMTQKLGKTPVKVNESAGFVVNRLLIPMVNEAIAIFAEGVATAEDIDTAMKLGANHPIGPLALGDLIGLDVCYAIMQVLYEETGDPKYRPHTLLHKMVRSGTLGRKTGKGFFTY